jgi:TnpA family transposase
MKKHEILSPQSRAALFDPPAAAAAIVRHYTFSPEDLALIRQRRRKANKLGFAVHLAYLRYPGRIIGVDEAPPEDLLRFIADQIGVGSEEFFSYAGRAQTRREHLVELQAYLNLRLARREDRRAFFKIALEEASRTDRGAAIVTATTCGHVASCFRLLWNWNAVPLLPAREHGSGPIRC